MQPGWVMTKEPPVGVEVDADIKWVSTLEEVEPTKLVLFESKGPSPKHPVWKLQGVEVVVWVVVSRSTAKRFRPPSNQEWRVEEKWIDHEKLGGVTNHKACVRVATRLTNHDVPLQAVIGLEAGLAQVLDCTGQRAELLQHQR